MSRTDIKVFIASSSELDDERKETSEVLIKLTKRYPNLYFDPIKFELDTASGNNPGKKRIQDEINVLLEQCQIVVVLFYSQIGQYTREELDIAIKLDKKIFLYFKEGFQSNEPEKIQKYLDLNNFRKELESQSSIRYGKFDSVQKYSDLLFYDISLYIDKKFVAESEHVSALPITNDLPINNVLNNYPKPKQYFIGRETELADFKNAIDSNETFIAIDGPGGIGKTQFVSKCIEQFIPNENVIWYECTTASQFDTLVSEAGYPDLLKGSSKTDREKFSAFKDKIEENEFFLFLDNFQDANGNPVFKEFLKFTQVYLKKGCVVVVDRDDLRSVDLEPKSIKIGGFTDNKLDYAKAVISHRYNDVRISDTELSKICEELRGYPLAIDFAILLLSKGITGEDIIKTIAHDYDAQEISERLLNAIFVRTDSTEEEKYFMRQFSVFTGSVTHDAVFAVIPNKVVQIAQRKLQEKNLLTFSQGSYEIHPLVREFCYKELSDKETVHTKVAEFYIQKRNDKLSPFLEEQIFYHLAKGKQWERVEKEIEEKGRQFILLGQLGLVKELLDKLKSIGIEKPIFDIFFGDIAEIHGDWGAAEGHYNAASRSYDDVGIRIEGKLKYGELLYSKWNLDESLLLYKEALALAEENIDLKNKSRALNDIGMVYQVSGNLDAAFKKYEQSLKIGLEIDDKESVAGVYLNIATLSEVKGKIDEAIKFIKIGLKLYQEIGDRLGIASSLNQLGNAASDKGRFDEALKLYQESLEIAELIGRKIGIGYSTGNIASILLKKNKPEEAIRNYEKSIVIFEEIGSESSHAVALNNIGNVLREQERFDEALIKLNKSLRIHEEIGNISGIATTCHTIGVCHFENIVPSMESAITHLIRSISINAKLGAKVDVARTMEWIIVIRKKVGLTEFKKILEIGYNKISKDFQSYIPMNELLKQPTQRDAVKLGRNDPCYCGNGKKFKNCHGMNN